MSSTITLNTLDNVANTYLPKIGEICLHSTKNNVKHITIAGSDTSAKLRIVGDTYFTNSSGNANYGQELTFTNSAQSVYISAGETYLYIPKYSVWFFVADSNTDNAWDILYGTWNYAPIRQMGIFNWTYKGGLIPLSVLYLPENKSYNFTASATSTITGDLSQIPNIENYTQLQLAMQAELTGNLSDLSNSSNCTDLRLGYTKVKGSLSDLYNMNKLTVLSLIKCDVTGTLEALATAWYESGRISGTCTVYADKTQITYNGLSFVNKTITFSSAGWSVS